MMDRTALICKLFSLKQPILVSFLSLSLIACGGGGDDDPESPPPDSVIMELGSPSANPFVTPPSSLGTHVRFFSVVSGNALPPEEVFLDEVDVNGQVVAANVTQLRDDGENVDSNLGDRIYSGSLLIGSVESTEKYYRVRTELEGEILTSGQMNFWVSGCPVRARPSDSNAAVFDTRSASLIFSNEVTMTVNEGVAPDLFAMNRIAAEVKGQIVGCIPAQREYLVEIEGDGAASGVYNAINTLNANPAVENAAINTQITGLPLGTGSPCDGDECQWYLDRIRAPDAWLLAGGGDEERAVAVIDFGVDCTHQELDCDASIHNQDLIDHGTGVASLINARANDGSPVVGVAWNTDLFPQSFLGNGGSQYKMNELINASLSDERVKVINISAGTAIDPSGNIRESICTAIDSGRLVVAAAGNAAQANNCELDNIYPAKYNAIGSCANGADLQSGLLVVGGIDINNNLAEWTDAGVGVCSNVLHVDLFAPGEDVFTASATEGYSTKNGTSYAAPLVAGAAAVLWSANPELTVSQVHSLLLGSGASLASDSDNPRAVSSDARVRGAPLLDVYRSVGGEDIIPVSGGSPELPDVEPEAFSFIDEVDTALAVVSISDSVTISGIDQATPIDVVGGYYSIDNGPFTGAAGSIKAGQHVRVRLTTASAPNIQREAMLTIGGVSDAYSVTTGDLPVTLDEFRFVSQTNLALAEVALSNEVVIEGIASNSPITIDVGEYSINGAGFTSGAGVIDSGDALRVRLTASSNYASSTAAIVTISGVTGRFQVTTVATDTAPDAFEFLSENNVSLATELVSNNITVSGINTEAFISISGGEYAINGGDYTANAGSIGDGQTVNIRLASANTQQTSTFSTLTIGGVSDTYRLTTLVLDTTPDAFSFTSQTNRPLNTLFTSNAQVISGINSPAAISINGGEYAIDGADFNSTENTVSAGQSVQVRVRSSADFSTTTAVALTIGGVTEVFNVTTFAADTTPDSFVFVDQTNIALGTEVTSNSITVSGLNTSVLVVIDNGMYNLNGGGYTAADGTVSNGDTLTIRLSSAASVATTVQATLTVGSISDTFSISTEGARLPDAFSFTDQADVQRNRQILSNTLTVTGLNSAVPISIAGGEYSVDGGGFTAAAGIITNGQSVQVRVQSSTEFATATHAALTISSISDTFTVVTEAEDTVPDAFGFGAEINAALNAQIESNVIVIAGINSAAQISIAGGEYRINSGSYTAAPGNINSGDTVQVRLAAAATPAVTSTATLTIGGTTGTFSVKTLPEDKTPDAFLFTDQADVALSTVTTSNAIMVSGINVGTFISVVGGEYRINSGGYTAASGNISSGDTVQVRLVAAATPAVTSTATLTIGGTTGTFSVTTLPEDSTPDAFSFTDQTDAPLNTQTTSNAMVVSGINVGTSISVVGGEYRINGGTFTALSGTVNDGDQVMVRLTSAADFNQLSTATVTIGGVTEVFSVTTFVVDTTPDNFVFVGQSNIALGTEVISNSITVSGLNTSVPVAIDNGMYNLNGGGYTAAGGKVSNGDTLTVRLTSSASVATTLQATLTVGSISNTFTVVTEAEDTVPDAFGFGAEVDAALNAQIESNVVSISGINSAAQISIAGGEYRINSGGYTAAPGNINSGDTVQVRLVAAATPAVTSTVTLTIGGTTGTFSVTTLPEDSTPDAFSFTNQTDAPLNTQVTSNAIVVSGINVGTSISVVGGEYSVNGGAFTAFSGTVDDGDQVMVRLTSAADFNQLSTATVTMGDVSGDFNVTTYAADTTPDAFSFSSQTDASLNAIVSSNSVTISGLNTETAISITGGEYAIDGGAFSSTAGIIITNQTVVVRLTAAALPDTTTLATLTVGDLSATFSVTTEAVDTIPDAFSFTAQTDAALNSFITSSSEVITGINSGAAISISNGEYAIDGGAFTTAAGSINANQSVQVRLNSSPNPATLTRATLIIGGVNAVFSVTTIPEHQVTASAGLGGTISPSNIIVLQGDTTSFVVTADANYAISSVTGCNGTLTADTYTYTTGTITAACTVNAMFASTDFTAPALQTFTPVNLDDRVAINQPFELIFDEPINPASVNGNDFSLMVGTTSVPSTVSVVDNKVLFTPDTPLGFSSAYTATFNGPVADLHGNSVIVNDSRAVTTMAAPTVISTETYAKIRESAYHQDDAGNILHVWWEGSGNGNGMPDDSESFYRYYNATSQTWTLPQVLEASNLGSFHIKHDNSNGMLLFYGYSSVCSRYFDGSAFSSETCHGSRFYDGDYDVVSNGNGYALVYRERFSSRDLYVKFFTPSTNAWSTPASIEQLSGVSSKPLIASDQSGYAVMWHVQNTDLTYDLHARVYDGNNWGPIMNILTASTSTQRYQLAGNSSGYAMTWIENDHYFVNLYNGTSNISQLDDSLSTVSTSNLRLTASAQGFAAGWIAGDALMANVFELGAWAGPNPVAIGIENNSGITLTAGTNDYLFTYLKALTGDYSLYTSRFNGVDWTADINPLDTAISSSWGYGPTISVNENTDRYLLVWNRENANVDSVYANVYDTGWGTTTTLDTITEADARKPDPISFKTDAGFLVNWFQDDGMGDAFYISRYTTVDSRWDSETGSPFKPVKRGQADDLSIATNDAGVSVAVWEQMDSSTSKLFYNIKNGANWSTAVSIPECGTSFRGIDIVSNGDTFMITCGTYPSSALISFLLSGTTLGQSQTVFSSTATLFSKEVLATNGLDYAAVFPTSGNNISINIFDTSTGQWTGEQSIATTTSYHGYSYPHIAGNDSGFTATWWDKNTDVSGTAFDIYASTYKNNIWSLPVKVNTTPKNWYASAGSSSIVSNGIDYVLTWGDSYSNLYTSTLNDSTDVWSAETLVANSPITSSHSAAFGSGQNTTWRSSNSVFSRLFNGTDWMTTELVNNNVTPDRSMGSLRTATNQTGYAAVWPNKIDALSNIDAYMARYENGLWTRSLVLENSSSPVYQIKLDAVDTKYRAIWTQPDQGMLADPNARRVWASGDF